MHPSENVVSNHQRLSEEPKSNVDKAILDDDYGTIHKRLHIPAPAMRFALMGMMKVDSSTQDQLLPNDHSDVHIPKINSTRSAATNRQDIAQSFQLELSEIGKLTFGINSVPTLSPTVELPENPLNIEDFAPTEDRGSSTSQVGSDIPNRVHHLARLDQLLEERYHQWIDLPPPEDIKSSRIEVAYGDEYTPINIHFDTSSLTRHQYKNAAHSQDSHAQARITALIKDIFPAKARIWSEVLSVQAPLHNMTPKSLICGAPKWWYFCRCIDVRHS